MPLVLILAEAALELVPPEIVNHPSVVAQAKRRDKAPNGILLDVSYHYTAMRALEQSEKRGRPDIVHFSILQALGCPLNKEGLLRTYIHTRNDHVVEIDGATRVPRNYDRFVSLMEQLFKEGQVPPKGRPLFQEKSSSLRELIERIQPTMLVALSTLGQPSTPEGLCIDLSGTERPAIIVGCFARGHFAAKNERLADRVVRIDKDGLDSWIVTSRVLYEYERAIGLTEKRL